MLKAYLSAQTSSLSALVISKTHISGEYNFTTNMLKAYLSAQTSSLSALVISKTHISGEKPRGRQLNPKVCGHGNAIFRILLSFFLCSAFNFSTMISR